MPDTSSANLSEAVGNLPVISDESDKTDLSSRKIETLRNNPIAIRACILSDVVRQKPIFKAYQEFQKELGEDTMTFQDYEYWYYRFYNGELDLEHNRSLDPKMKELSDLSVDVVGSIIQRSDYKEQLVLRKVSKSLRTLVDQQKPACKSIEFVCDWPGKINCIYDEKKVIYAPPAWLEYRDKGSKKVEEKENVLIIRDDFEEIAFVDLASTLKNPKLQLDYLYFDCYDSDYRMDDELEEYMKKILNKIRDVLSSLDHKISVKKCKIDVCPDFIKTNLLSILPYLKPGMLETICLDIELFDIIRDTLDGLPEAIEEISGLEQWKQATELQFYHIFDDFPLEHAKHFKRFEIYEYSFHYILTRMIERLSTLPNLEYCSIDAPNEWDTQELHAEVGDPAPPNERTQYISHYPIANSNDYLEIEFLDDLIEVYRKNRSRS